MASTLQQNTFSATYKDDFLDSDNYHRILFNAGKALQARELTQLQTIINKEVENAVKKLKKNDHIICSHLDRFSRNTLNLLTWVDRFKRQKINLHFVDVGGEVTGSDAMGSVFVKLLSVPAMAETKSKGMSYFSA